MKAYLNGNFVDEGEAKVSVFDHGFLYGDGVFEGIRAYNRRVFKLREHMERLYESAKAIDLQIPISMEEVQKKVI
jgi:branched-chain amino acid aminotransferase